MRLLFFMSCFFSLFGCFSSTAFSQDMTPLRQAVAEESSPSRQVYAAERCAGLFAAVYARMSGTGREDIEQLAVKNLMLASEASMLAVEIGRDAGMNITSESVLQVSLRISEQYKKKMDASYDLTGNSFDEFILEDQDFCVAFVSGQQHSQTQHTSKLDGALPADILTTSEVVEENFTAGADICQLTRLSRLDQGGIIVEEIAFGANESEKFIYGYFGANLVTNANGVNIPFAATLGGWEVNPMLWEEYEGGYLTGGQAALGLIMSILGSDQTMLISMMENKPIDWDEVTFVRFDGSAGGARYQITFGEKTTDFANCLMEKEAKIKSILAN